MSTDLNINKDNIDGSNIYQPQQPSEIVSKISVPPIVDEVTVSQDMGKQPDASFLPKDHMIPSLLNNNVQPKIPSVNSPLFPNPDPNPEVLKGTAALFSNSELNLVSQKNSGNLSIAAYMKQISDMIQKLQQEIYRAEQMVRSDPGIKHLSQLPNADSTDDNDGGTSANTAGSQPTSSSDGGGPPSSVQPGNQVIDLSPFVSSFMEASRLNPKLSELMLVGARFDVVKGLIGNQSKDSSIVDISNYPDLVAALKRNGFLPLNSNGKLSQSDVKNIGAALDQQIKQETNKAGALGTSLYPVLNTAINGVLPMLVNSGAVFELLCARSQMEQWGYEGKPETLASDKAILSQQPGLLALMKSTGLISNFFNSFSDEQITGLMGLIETSIEGRIKSTPVTAQTLVTYNSQRAGLVGIDAAKNFLEMLGPIQDVLRKYAQKENNEILDEAKLTASNKQGALDTFNAAATVQLLKSSVNPASQGSGAENFKDAIQLLNDLSQSVNLVKAFFDTADYQKQKKAWESQDLGMVHKHSNDKTFGDLPKNLRIINNHINNPMSNNTFAGMQYGFNRSWDYEFIKAISNLSVYEAPKIPKVYEFLRANPELKKFVKNYDAILADDPLVKATPGKFESYKPTELKISNESIKQTDTENLATMRATLKMLQKMLASLQQGSPVAGDIGKVTKKMSEMLGTSEAAPAQYIAQQSA